jgi:hypothetical protein
VHPHALVPDEQVAHAEDEHVGGRRASSGRLARIIQCDGGFEEFRGGRGESGNHDRPLPFS